ncbi:MAG: glycosyltransferase family 2 protein [Solirubrobacteraceae bacterium]
MTELSVVIPVYGCAPCLPALHRRLAATLDGLVESYEIVFVDDRSPDGAWATLEELAATHPEVRILRLSRNFGQHAAITAGLAESSGRWAVVMDCDLQDPPEAIPALWAKAQEGYDVVLSRRKRRRQSLPRRLAGSAYYRLRNFLVRTDMYINYTNLSIVSRKVVDAFLTLRDRDRQYLLIVHWLGFHHTAIEVEQAKRHSGRSAYSFSRLVRVAVDGMFFQSTVLLRWIIYSGFAVASLGVLLVAYTIFVLLEGRSVPDWTALPMLILLATGFMLVSTGVTGLYVGKIFTQVKGRPLYVIDSRVVGGVERAVPHELSEYAEAAPSARAEEPAVPPPAA